MKIDGTKVRMLTTLSPAFRTGDVVTLVATGMKGKCCVVNSRGVERECNVLDWEELPVQKDPMAKLWQGVHPSAWNFWEIGVSHTMLETFRNCMEHMRLKYVLGWRARTSTDALEFGNVGHSVVDDGYDHAKVLTVKQVRACIDIYDKQWLARNPRATKKAREEQLLLYGLAEVTMVRYFQRWSGDFTGKYAEPNATLAPRKWLGRELAFRIPYVFPDGAATWINGRYDGIFLDKREQEWIFESKFKGYIDEETIADLLPTDPQVMMYMWVRGSQAKDKASRPKGVLYNVVRRPGHRQKKDESNKQFLDRVASELNMPKNRDHYFIRFECPITWGEVEQWKKEWLDPLMTQMRMWWEGRLPHRMEPNALQGRYGRSDYYEAIVRNDFTRLYQTKAAKELLAERS